MIDYVEKLKKPKWQRKRLEIMKRDDFTCQLCGDSESTLHVHHKIYKDGKAPWEYDDSNLITLCETCHDGEKNINDNIENLNREIKKKFFSEHIQQLYFGLKHSQLVSHPDVMSSAFRYAFENKYMQWLISELYFIWIGSSESKERVKNGWFDYEDRAFLFDEKSPNQLFLKQILAFIEHEKHDIFV